MRLKWTVKRVSPFASDVMAIIEELNQHNLALYPAAACYLDPPEV
jgi:hypothetical protein